MFKDRFKTLVLSIENFQGGTQMNMQENMEVIENKIKEVEVEENKWDSKYAGTNELEDIANRFSLVGELYESKFKNYELAGKYFEKAAARYEKLFILEDSAKHYEEASKNFEKSIDSLSKASINYEKSAAKYNHINDNRFLQNIDKAIYDCSEAERLYKVAGKNEKSNEMYIKKHDLEKKYFKNKIKSKYVGHLIWKISTNYGTSLIRLSIVSIIIYLAFSYVYWDSNLITLSQLSNEQSLNYSTTIGDALYFSAVNFIGINYGDLIPRLSGRLVAVSQGVLGVGLLAVFIAIAVNKIIQSYK